MRRDYLIAILLGIAAMPAGATLMVAPSYLHLTGEAVPITFWGGIGLTVALILAAAIIALRGEVKSIQEKSMTPANVGYNVALVAALATVIAAVRHSPRVAVIACLVAWAGIGLDYWSGPPRVFLWNKPQGLALISGATGWPIGVEPPNLVANISSAPGQTFHITGINVFGANLGDEEVKLDDVYLLSGKTGQRMDLHAFLGKSYAIKDLNPVPPKAYFMFFANSFKKPESQEEFLSDWGIIYVMA